MSEEWTDNPVAILPGEEVTILGKRYRCRQIIEAVGETDMEPVPEGGLDLSPLTDEEAAEMDRRLDAEGGPSGCIRCGAACPACSQEEDR